MYFNIIEFAKRKEYAVEVVVGYSRLIHLMVFVDNISCFCVQIQKVIKEPDPPATPEVNLKPKK